MKISWRLVSRILFDVWVLVSVIYLVVIFKTKGDMSEWFLIGAPLLGLILVGTGVFFNARHDKAHE